MEHVPAAIQALVDALNDPDRAIPAATGRPAPGGSKFTPPLQASMVVELRRRGIPQTRSVERQSRFRPGGAVRTRVRRSEIIFRAACPGGTAFISLSATSTMDSAVVGIAMNAPSWRTRGSVSGPLAKMT
jgi:hypothetical protein